MSIEVTVPTLGESVSEATVARWRKARGEAVAVDEPIVELETDKVTLEVNAPVAGTLADIVAETGAVVLVGALLALISEGGTVAAPAAGAKDPGPAARRALAESGVDPGTVAGTGKDGRITKADVAAAASAPRPDPEPARVAGPEPIAPRPPPVETPAVEAPRSIWGRPSTDRPRAAREERVRLTRLRQRIAERLKDAQNTAAILSTFNEVDMTAVRAVRDEYKEVFERKHGVKLGFMSFFARAAIKALAEFPAVNAEVDGTDIVYKNYYDLGIAVGAPKGLVVPVLRDADRMSFAEIEAGIAALGRKARDGTLSIDDLSGGTFTISNGGVYGSLLSTPIINPPQSGILGMHKIQDRPVAIDGQVVIRPMMYLALSYDHRVIDGREAVGFLVRIKELVEDPRRLILDV